MNAKQEKSRPPKNPGGIGSACAFSGGKKPVFAEHAAGTEEQLDVHRLQGMRRQLSAIHEQMENLRCDSEALEAQIEELETGLTTKFEYRVRAIGAELISIEPSRALPGTAPQTYFIELTPEQRTQFIEKFMAAGMSKGDADNAILRILSRFVTPALAPIDQYFRTILPDRLVLILAGQENLVYAGENNNLPEKYQVALTKADVVADKDGKPTLSDEAKQKLRINILTAVATGDYNISAGWHSVEKEHIDHIWQALKDCLEGLVIGFRNNGCKGDVKC